MKKYLESLNNFKDKKIIVLGDVMLDKFCWGKIERINPEQPAAPNVYIEKETYSLGGVGNVANNIVSLGGNCILYGAVGEDFFGKKIKKMCLEKKIEFIEMKKRKSTLVKQRVMAHGQQITRLNYGENENNLNLYEEILNSLQEKISLADFIILSDYNKGFFNKNLAQEIIKLSKEKNIQTLVDPKPENALLFRGCDMICPNKYEASKITNINYSKSKETLINIGEKLSEILNSKYSVITCGENGVFVYDSQKKKSKMIETRARKIADVAGAGDTFAATLAISLSSGMNIYDASEIANYAAGNVVEKQGVETTTINEIKSRILQNEKVIN